MSYIPSAPFVRTSITSCLSSALHLRIHLSVLTTNLIKLSMSRICPFSRWREMEYDVKGLRTTLTSISGRLVRQRRRFGSSDLIRSSMKFRTSSRDDGMSTVIGHSSKPSTTKKTGGCPGSLRRSFKHLTSASSLACCEPLPCSE